MRFLKENHFLRILCYQQFFIDNTMERFSNFQHILQRKAWIEKEIVIHVDKIRKKFVPMIYVMRF